MIDLERSLTELADRLEIPAASGWSSDVVRRIAEPAPLPLVRRRAACPRSRAAVLALWSLRWRCPARVARWPVGSVSTACASNPASLCRHDRTRAPVRPAGAPAATSSHYDIDRASVGSRCRRIDRGGDGRGPACQIRRRRCSVHRCPSMSCSHRRAADRGGLPAFGTGAGVPVTGAGALVSVMPAQRSRRASSGRRSAAHRLSVPSRSMARRLLDRGSPHELMFEFGDQVLPDTFRLATNTCCGNAATTSIASRPMSISKPPCELRQSIP